MNLTGLDEKTWQRLNAELDAWYDKVDVSAPEQIAFQRENPEFSSWLDAELVPSILCGEAAASHCLESIVSEPNDVLRHTKFLAAYAVWEGLDAPPNDVSADLKIQGWTQQRLSEQLKLRMLAPYRATNIFEQDSPRPLH